MKNLRRWLIVMLSLTVVADFLFYRLYFTSTDSAIGHAGSFLFRRMSVTQLADLSQRLAAYVYSSDRGAAA